jgi:hypothetical protein
MNAQKLIVCLFLLLLFFSCSKEVEIEIPGYKEQLVVEGRIETDGFPLVMLSKSQDVYSSTDLLAYLGSFISDATVSVSDGQQTIVLEVFNISDLPVESQKTIAEMLKLELHEVVFLPIPIFSTAVQCIKGEVGKTYTLTIEEGGKTYTGKTILLPPVPLQQSYWKPSSDNPEYGLVVGRLSDPPNQYNAYKWEAKRITPQANGEPLDTLFRRAPGSYFDDRFFDGITFEFDTYNRQRRKDESHLEEFRRYYRLGDIVVAKFSRLDRDVFEFYNKMNEQQENMGNPFAVPVNAPSNISGALGVWAGVSTWFDTIVCEP